MPSSRFRGADETAYIVSGRANMHRPSRRLQQVREALCFCDFVTEPIEQSPVKTITTHLKATERAIQ